MITFFRYKEMINLIPTVWQALYMQKLGKYAIKEKVKEHRNVLNQKLKEASLITFQKGVEEGLSKNPLRVENDTYTAQIYTPSVSEEPKDIRFTSTRQLYDFISGKYDLLPEPIKTYRFPLKGYGYSPTYFSRRGYLEARYMEHKGSVIEEEIEKRRLREAYGFELNETKINKKITYNILLNMFKEAPTIDHPKNTKVKVRFVELFQYVYDGESETMLKTQNHIKIYKFVELAESKLFSDYPTSLSQSELIKQQQSMENVFDNVFNNIDIVKKTFKPPKLERVNKNIKHDVNYTEIVRRLASNSGIKNKGQIEALQDELKKEDIDEGYKKALEKDIEVLNNQKAKVFMRDTLRGIYILDIEKEGDKYDKETNANFIIDKIVDSNDRTNKGQLDILVKMKRAYSQDNKNPNKYDYLAQIEKMIDKLKKLTDHYWGYEEGTFGLVKIKEERKNVFGKKSEIISVKEKSESIEDLDESSSEDLAKEIVMDIIIENDLNHEAQMKAFEQIKNDDLGFLKIRQDLAFAKDEHYELDSNDNLVLYKDEKTNVLNLPEKIDISEKEEIGGFTFIGDTGEKEKNVMGEREKTKVGVKPQTFKYDSNNIYKTVKEKIDEILDEAMKSNIKFEDLKSHVKEELLKTTKGRTNKDPYVKNVNKVIKQNNW